MDIVEGKYQGECDIINANVHPQISSIDGVSLQTDFDVKKKTIMKETLQRKSERSGIYQKTQ